MSDIQPTITGFISPYGDYNLRNTQALSGVSHIWQDFLPVRWPNSRVKQCCLNR